MNSARSWAAFVPAATLTAVALVQIAMAWPEGSRVSPAKGGGFGMFSTVDRLTNRYLFVIAVQAGRERRVKLRSSRLGERALSNPTEENLQALGRSVVGRVNADELRIEVWTLSWSSAPSRARRNLLARTTVPARPR